MVITTSYDKDILGHEVRGTNTSYYGISALQAVINHDEIRADIAKYLYKGCTRDMKE